MKVELINYTQDALATLVFTKSTRLKMTAAAFNEYADKICTEEGRAELLKDWAYMQNTIKSSWEFVDYIFSITGVSRAFTHQLVRHRIGTSFAQQSQRTVDMSGFDYVTPDGIRSEHEADDNCHVNGVYADTMNAINKGYQDLIQLGAPPQDARGVLPTNVSTNIIFKANLRTLNGMCAERLCVKAQGEFQSVMRAIRDEVIKVHDWAEPALRVHCAQHGTCAFPTFTGCPIKGGVFNPELGARHDASDIDLCLSRATDDGFGDIERPMTKEEIHQKWLATRAEAQPGIVNKKESE